MFSVDLLRDLFAHMEWADARVWQTTLAHPPAAGDARVRELLLHIRVVQRAFLDAWTSQPVTIPDAGEFPDIASVQAWGSTVYAEQRAFLDTLDAAALARPMTMPWAAEFEKLLERSLSTPSLAETMFQITSHSTHHRGQVNARLRELGAEPPLVDYIAWTWFGKPNAEWTTIVRA